MDRNLYWIWLADVLGPASELPLILFQHFRSIEDIYFADEDAYSDCPGIKASEIRSLCDKDLHAAKRIYDACVRLGVGLLPYDSTLYPDRLRRIHQPPVLLYYKGYIPDFSSRLSLAVVGTRGMTDEGRVGGYRIAYELAIAGAIIISGMAIGVDGIAHKAALDAGGTTVAVLGSAIDRPYPVEHTAMYDRLVQCGGIISEYPPGMRTQRWHFPQRNRIISGLCQGTLIVEAGENSGALITAKSAITQGRDLFAMPGDPSEPARVGTNTLIKAGAAAVTEAADILRHYESLYQPVLHPEHLRDPAYFTAFDNTLRYGHEQVARHRAANAAPHTRAAVHSDSAAQEAHPPIPVSPPRQPAAPMTDARPLTALAADAPAARRAPAAQPLREEPYSAPEKDEMLEEQSVRPAPVSSMAIPDATPQPPASPSTPAHEKEDAAPAHPRLQELSEEQAFVLSMVRKGMSFDEMCKSGMEAAHLLVNITYLELIGCIRAVPGGRYEYIE